MSEQALAVNEELPGETDLAEVQNNAPMVQGVAPLAQMIAQGNLSMEQVEKMMELQERHDANEARKSYNVAMAQFRAQVGIVTKTGKNAHLKSTYATLDDLINAASEPLGNCGFNYSFGHSQDEAKEIKIHCSMTHAAGHSETVSIILPVDVGGNKAINPAQAIGLTISYGKRYCFSSLTGMSSEDDDGQSAGPVPRTNQKIEIIDDKQLSTLVDLVEKAENLKPGTRKRWVNAHKVAFSESSNQLGVDVPLKNFNNVKNKLLETIKVAENDSTNADK